MNHRDINHRTCQGCSDRIRAATGVFVCGITGKPIDRMAHDASCPRGLHVGIGFDPMPVVAAVAMAITRIDAGFRAILDAVPLVQTLAKAVARATGKPCCGKGKGVTVVSSPDVTQVATE